MYPGQRFNGYSHLAGLVLALGAAVVLLRSVVPRADAQLTVAAAVFAGSVVLLYGASTLAHSVRGDARAFWERLDHGAIYLLIGGTYTPFALSVPTAPWHVVLLLIVWILCGWGAWIELRTKRSARPSTSLYLCLGWICVVGAFWSHSLTLGAIALLLAGAGFYSLGTIFYRNVRAYRHAHGIWHLFVIAGTAMHYLAVGLYVL